MKDQYHSLRRTSAPLSKPDSKNVYFLTPEWTDLSSLTGGCYWGYSLKMLLMQATTALPQASWSSSRNSLCWNQTGCFCWSFSTCYNNNDIFFRKKIGTGAFVQYKSTSRTRQEGEGSHLFSSICNSSFDWNISSWTLLWLRNIWKALALTILRVLTKKKATLCLLLPAPFLSNGLLCWRM